jgi:C_GCAxxG_C_C family probable redox protein
MEKPQEACARFKQGFSCSQAVLSAYAEDLGLDGETALRVAGAFGGGMARTGQTCGAVSGGLMVIGLRFGAVNAQDKASKERAYAAGQELMAQFVERNGSLQCKDLLGCDLSTPEGRQMAHEQRLTAARCPRFVEDAARIVEELL